MKTSIPFKVVSTCFLAASLLVSGTPPTFAETTNPSKITNAEQYLQHLSKQDRDRIHNNQELGVPNKHLSPTLETFSNKPVNIIVQFAQDPAEAAVKKNAENGKTIALSEARKKVEESHQNFKAKIGQAKKG
jgi:hypothetical protein